MQSKYSILLLGVFILISSSLSAQNFLENINISHQAYSEMVSLDLFEIEGKITRAENVETGLKNGLVLMPNFDVFAKIRNQKDSRIKISLPTSETHTINLILQEVNILAESAVIRTSSGESLDFSSEMGRFFWGVVEGSPNSMVNISFFEDHLMGFISIGMHDFTLGKLEDSPQGLHVFYHNNELELPFTFECHMTEDHRIGASEDLHPNTSRSTGGCINMYVEADYNVFQNKGSVGATIEYVLGLFSQVIILYANESIDMAVSELLVWDSPSPYSGNDAFDFLEQFSDELNGNFNGDLAHLVRIGPQLGGVAWLDVLCGWNPYFRTGFSGIASTYEEVPTYSWSVSVVAHEIGHNVGSGHTHGCYWNNNDTQIDDCGNVFANDNGFDVEGEDCFNANNPIIPSNGGTIMSYCHLIQNVGINFNHGFGQQPGDLMRSKVNNASCLGDCADINPPIADFSGSPTYGCAPMEVQFIDLSENDPTSWDWNFPGGNPSTSSEQLPTVIYNFAGIFDVSLEVSNDDGSDFLSLSDYITVEDIPTAAFSFNVDDLTVGFINNSQDGFSYLWDFGDGNFSNEVAPVHTYFVGGTYIVELTVFNNCGEDVFSAPIDVFELPEADFSFDLSSGCAPLTVQFFDASSGDPDFFSWEFPGGSPSVSNAENPVVIYTNPGIFDVTLTVGNPLGNSSLEIEDLIEVFPTTEADFEYEIEGRNVVFSSLALNVDSLSWDFGDGTTSHDTMPEHLYQEDGIYEVVLIAIGECGIDTTMKNIEILTPPATNFDLIAEGVCVPVSVVFINMSSSNTESVSWTFPGGSPSMSSSDTVVVVYEEPGFYGFSLVAFGAGGVDTMSTDSLLVFYSSPSGDFGFEIDDFEVAFSQNSIDADGWLWNFGDGNSSSEENPTHTFETEGRYEVILSLFNLCDTFEISQTITIGDFPSSSFSVEGSSRGCAPFEVNFINLSSPPSADVEWFFEGGNPESSNDPNPTVIYDTPGLYSVRLTVSNVLGEDVYQGDGVVEVLGLPEASFEVIDKEDGNFEFVNNSSDAENFLWDFGDGNSSDAENPLHQYESSGSYQVELIAINSCGSDTISVEVQYTFVYLFEELSARLYPNPSAGQVFVEFTENISSEIKYKILDISGKELRSGELLTGDLKHLIDFGSFPSGSYFLQFYTEKSHSRAMQVQIVKE